MAGDIRHELDRTGPDIGGEMLEEAVSLVMRGEIRDGKTICGLLMARETIRRQKENA